MPDILPTPVAGAVLVADGERWNPVDAGDLSGLPAVEPAAAVADLALTVTDPPTQAEVQSIADKLDDLLASLRTAGLLAES